MADVGARMSVEIDGLMIEVNVEGGRDLAAMGPLAAAARAADRCARAMQAALARETGQ